MPREDSIHEKAVRKWAALQELDPARVSRPKIGCGFFVVEWASHQIVASGRDATFEDLEDYLPTIEAPQPPQLKQSAKSKRRKRVTLQSCGGLSNVPWVVAQTFGDGR